MAKFMKLSWEYVDVYRQKPAPYKYSHLEHGPGSVKRARIPGGWLVAVGSSDSGRGLVFVPDPMYKWTVQVQDKLNTIPKPLPKG